MIEQVYLTVSKMLLTMQSTDSFCYLLMEEKVCIFLLHQQIIFHPHLSSFWVIYIQITTYSNFVGSFYVKNKILNKGNFIEGEDNT